MEGSYKLIEEDIIKHHNSNSHTTQAESNLIESNKSSKLVIQKEEENKKNKGPKLLMCTALTKYRVVKKAAKNLDFKLNDDETMDWDIFWSDTTMPSNKVQKM